MTVVIDASVAVKWVLDEPGSDEAEVLISDELFAPHLFPSECANVLWNAWRRREIDAEEARAKLADILAGGVILHAPPLDQALHLAMRLTHSVYDCTYVALAQARGAAFATADRKFAGKLTAAGIDVRLMLIGPDHP